MQGNELGELYLSDLRTRLRGVKALGEGALKQLHEPEWHAVLSAGGNSAAVTVQHLSGNMHSRWGALQHGYRAGQDGEQATRNRDAEFEEGQQTGAQLWAIWEAGWTVFLEALDALTSADLTRTLRIRGETHTVLEALQRQVAHYSGHVYQLVFLVKTLRGPDWHTLSIARGQSAAFNAAMHKQQQP
ncbi:DUF1572 family protein [Deinococcus ruber]|uniref:DUF1572 domain-containing protein n=1 Tax=Deinococcus ruber TaxID=1848197 RepID=A0A918F6G6_9DEIO|nr:DUF1572 family protein [Deinococcus ruber]GGR12567.1 hypothetical protein GCM10008957_26900 [Deinococcus ruber]